MSSASYCQFVISPSPCRVVHVAVMRSFKQTNNKPNVYVWIGGVGSEVGRINFICGFEVNTSKISRIYAGRSRTSAISKHQSGGYLFRQARLKKIKDRGVRIRAREERRSSCGCVGVRALVLMRMGGAREGEGGGHTFFPLPPSPLLCPAPALLSL